MKKERHSKRLYLPLRYKKIGFLKYSVHVTTSIIEDIMEGTIKTAVFLPKKGLLRLAERTMQRNPSLLEKQFKP